MHGKENGIALSMSSGNSCAERRESHFGKAILENWSKNRTFSVSILLSLDKAL